MTTPKHFVLRRILGLVCLIGLTACVSAPQGPHVAVMPTPGKPLDLFAAEDQYCRGYAQQSLGPDTRSETAVGTAVVGTLLGAAVGSALSGRHYNNTGAGAATGLMMGTMIGAGNSAQEGRSAQQRYDIAYEQCMVSKNNQPSQRYHRSSPPAVVVVPQTAPAPYYPPPPPPAAGQVPPPSPPPQ
jgi:hypothetical protein